ncbi:MAG: AAA family ATPase [Leptospiraceae bacterium]|nr:AAA family ATPase [Leptospiraceae bacterium]MCP5497132.1 AAA family ATPase [Leptospiraceae bacterium]
MEFVEIAGIKVPVYKNQSKIPIIPSNLVETPTCKKNLQNILYPMLEGYPVLLIGDAGVGKNALVYYINHKRNHPTFRFSFNEDTLPEDLIGSYRLLMTGQGFEWVNGPLVDAIEMGATFVADEMNLTSPNVIKRLSTVYQSQYIDLLEGNNSRKKAKEGFSLISTQNPAEGFEGRKNLPFDITRHFAVVFVDPYPPDEILLILQQLYPDLTSNLIKTFIRITLETEKRILTGTLGKGDLEKYHFNIRTLKKICNRISTFGEDKNTIYREVYNIYVEPFRKPTDVQEQAELIKKELGFEERSSSSEIKFFVRDNKLYCNDKSISIQNEENSKNLLASVPLTSKVKEFLEKVITGIQTGENILIEFDEEDDPEFLLPVICNLTGMEIESVNLCKGIHTSDILGALKPLPDGKIDWIDGPLTRGIRNGTTILITGLEAAGAELVEKLNMLTDDARAITLPPESGLSEPLALKTNANIFAIKQFRKTKSASTISRAFRNRFTAVLFPNLEDEETLKELLDFYLPDAELIDLMAKFHTKIKDISHRRTIGSANIMPYSFGLTNLLMWKDHIYRHNKGDVKEIVLRGANIAYINQLSDPKERRDVQILLEYALENKKFPADIFQKIENKKKTYTISTDIEKKKWWDPELHKRAANTGKAKPKLSGNPLRKGLNINTPETGGKTKEGADAWYGQETRGNMGQGEPAGGGGAWGYRTEELYKQFLAKRKILFDYSILVTLKEFKEVFGKEIEEVELNLEKLFDPEIDISRSYRMEGTRIDARKYLSFMSGRGDTRVFDKTVIDKKDEKLKGVEVVFLVCKARRIFNFEYSIATLAALITSSFILKEHNVKFAVHTYSDLLNRKDHIDLNCIKHFEEDYDDKKEEEIFDEMCQNWQGDSVYEYVLLENCERYFSREAQTKIIVMVSDFRGQRGKYYLQDEITSYENKKLKEEVLKNTNKSYIFLGVGLGNREVAEHVFPDSIQITSENFSHMPNMIGTELSRLILTHHSMRN